MNFDKRKGKKVDEDKLNQLYLEISYITGNAEMIETEDGDVILDPISEAKVDEIEKQIHLELLKGGYSMEEVYDECMGKAI